jgi:class 3 adenylate cyclase
MIAGQREAMKRPVQRRLAAILAADVAGYSRLMGADERARRRRCVSIVPPMIRSSPNMAAGL